MLVLLGSVASANYTTASLEVVDRHQLFPAEFVGRAHVSCDGLMLRSAASGQELTYTLSVVRNSEGRDQRGSSPSDA